MAPPAAPVKPVVAAARAVPVRAVVTAVPAAAIGVAAGEWSPPPVQVRWGGWAERLVARAEATVVRTAVVLEAAAARAPAESAVEGARAHGGAARAVAVRSPADLASPEPPARAATLLAAVGKAPSRPHRVARRARPGG